MSVPYNTSVYSKGHMAQYEPISRLVHAEKWKGRLTEIGVNGEGQVWVRVAGQGTLRLGGKEASWSTLKYFEGLCQSFAAANKIPFDPSRPILPCKDPFGNRLQVNMGAHVEGGIAMTLRIKRHFKAAWSDFGLEEEQGARIAEAIQSEKTIFISGGTNTGKTTFADLCASQIPEHVRTICVEDTPEITQPHWNFVRLMMVRIQNERNMVGPREIVDSIMRLTPQAIIMGEISVDNAFPCLRLMGSGHGAFMTTVHSNNPFDALRATKRNVALSSFAGVNTDDVLEFLAETIDLIIQIKHDPGADGLSERRYVHEITTGAEIMAKHFKALKDDDDFARRDMGAAA